MRDFLREIESLMEQDEGTIFQMQHLEAHEELTDLLEEEGYGES
jgi:hypothetical protein